MGGQVDRIKDREVRQGLVLGEKESSASGPATRLLGHPQQIVFFLVGSVLRNNVLRLWGLWLSCGRFQVLHEAKGSSSLCCSR